MALALSRLVVLGRSSFNLSPLPKIMITTTTPRLYVGTYAKYNTGSIQGAWIDLTGHTKDSFLEACHELHSDEADPEFMFQDFEGFPRAWYDESSVSDELFEFLNLPDDEREMLECYADAFGYCVTETSVDTVTDAYAGEADSVEAFAEQWLEETGQLGNLPDWVQSCIDWEAVWNSALRFDFAHTDTRNSNGNLVFFYNR